MMTEEISRPYTVAEVARRRGMELNFSLTLPDAMYREFIEVCRECNCSPKQFAAESLESALASRRLPGVVVGRQSPRIIAADAGDLENVNL